MRLTNVSQMDLVSGRVFSYGVQVAPAMGRELRVSFDQGRHVGLGERPGSWMAIAFRLASATTTKAHLGAAWDAVVARHGSLHEVFSLGDDGAVLLHDAVVSPGTWHEHVVGDGQRTRDVVREIFDARCAPFQQPSHRLCVVVPEPDAPDLRPELLIGSDHAHVDLWSLSVLAREFLTCLDDLRHGRAPGAALPSVAPFADHTEALAAMPAAPGDVVERWTAIVDAGGGEMPIFPLPLGELSPLPAEVVEVRDVLDADGTEQLAALARERGVRLIALGISVLTDATAALAGRPLRAVFPVHSRNEPRWRDAVGWFITNAVIESADPDPVACVGAVEEAIGLGSWPLAPILASLDAPASQPGLFALSWLDARRLPMPTDHATEFRYVSAAIRTDGVMIWFIVNESGIHLRCRYPDTPQARTNVGAWLDAVEFGLRSAALRAPDLGGV